MLPILHFYLYFLVTNTFLLPISHHSLFLLLPCYLTPLSLILSVFPCFLNFFIFHTSLLSLISWHCSFLLPKILSYPYFLVTHISFLPILVCWPHFLVTHTSVLLILLFYLYFFISHTFLLLILLYHSYFFFTHTSLLVILLYYSYFQYQSFIISFSWR